VLQSRSDLWRLVSFVDLRLCVWLALPLDRVRVKGCGISRNEARSGGNQGAVEDPARFTAGAHVDAGGIDALLVSEVLLDVEVALCCGVGGFVGRVPTDYYQPGSGVAVECEGDFVETALSFVVDADGTLLVALEGDAAEGAYWRWWWRRRSRDGNGGGGGGLFAEIVDGIAGHRDRPDGSATSTECRRRSGSRDLAGRSRIGEGDGAVLRTGGD